MPPPPLPSEPSTPPAPATTDVLIVDDSPQLARILSRAFRHKGLSCSVVERAFHATVALERVRYRVVLADQRMPGVEGAELLNYVAQRWPQTRLILMSAWMDAATMTACPAAHRVFDKSFPLNRIVEIVLEEVYHAPRP